MFLSRLDKSINDTVIKPSYSGLLPYEKQDCSSPLVFSKGQFPFEDISR